MPPKLILVLVASTVAASIAGVAARGELPVVLNLAQGSLVVPRAETDASDVREYPGIGRARKLDNGLYEVTAADGFVSTTHGPDPMEPPVHGVGTGNSELERPAHGAAYESVDRKKAQKASGLPRLPVRCVDPRSTQHAIELVYLAPLRRHPEGGFVMTDQQRRAYEAANARMTAHIEYISWRFSHRSRQLGGPDMRPRVVCLKGRPWTYLVGTDKRPKETYETMMNAVRASGRHHWNRKYLTMASGNADFFGIGDLAWDIAPQGHKHMQQTGYAFCMNEPDCLLHELVHTLGGVQWNTPRSSNRGHCVEGLDLMCYDDSPRTDDPRCRPSKEFQKYGCAGPCPRALPSGYRGIVGVLDCMGDDYFHPKPKPGSYLAKHWNLASSANRYMWIAPPGRDLPPKTKKTKPKPKPKAKAKPRPTANRSLSTATQSPARGPRKKPTIDPKVAPAPVPGG